MTRLVPRVMVLLLCGSALMGCAGGPDLSDLTGGKTAADPAKNQLADGANAPGTDLDGSVRQAQLLRLAGHYDEAVHILSQLMLVASDDGRVVGEYGKTLAEMGRSQDAADFLTRAVQLQANDWTVYSALGVAYDELGNQPAARMAYEHALALKPDEPSVLSNYALSRMMADDPQSARQLIERARIAGGGNDPKIARNIALVNEMAPATASAAAPQVAYAVHKAAPDAKPAPAQPKVASAPLPAIAAPVRTTGGAPRPLQPQQTASQASGVVMQPVPVDPLAGPVKTHRKPVAKTAKATPDTAQTAPAARPAMDIKPAAKPAVKAAQAAPAAKASDAKSGHGVPSLRLAADKY